MDDKKTGNDSSDEIKIEAEIQSTQSEIMPKANYESVSNSPVQNPKADNSNPMFNQRASSKNIMNNNNPALGQRRLNNSKPVGDGLENNNNSLNNNNKLQKDGSNNLNSNSNNPAAGNKNAKADNSDNKNINSPNNQSDNNKADNKSNPLPGTTNNKKNDTDKKDNDANKNSVKPKEESTKKFNPKRNIQDFAPSNLAKNIKSKLGLGKDKNEKGDSSNQVSDAAKQGLKQLWIMLPMSVKITVGATAGIFALVMVILLAVLGGTTAAVIGSSVCDNTSYTANSSDSMSFLCNMSSPFGPEAEGKEYSVTSTSGRRVPPPTQYGYGSNFHEGTDVTGVKGKNLFTIYAVADGEVVQAGWNGGYGNSVLINHNDMFFTRYGHLSSISSDIRAGVKVKAGDKLGIMGNTGNSGGVHLHFELRDKDKKYLSANPYFGYSDQGYEKCLDSSSSIDNTKCDFSYTGSARYIGQSGFAQICGKTSNYSNNGNNSNCCQSINTSNEAFSESLLEYINKFEGGGKSCSTATGTDGYLAENIGDGAVTAGHGVTNAVVKRQSSQKIIASSGYKNQFSLSGNMYVMRVGGCYNKKLIDQLELSAIQEGFGSAVVKSAEKNNVSLQSYEIDALTSFNYNLGAGYTDKLVLGYKDGGYEGLWNVMKNYIHVNGQVWSGLQKRRKAEFALFVTGDYTDKGLFYSRTIKDYDNFDSENVMARKATGSASSCDVSNSSNNDVVSRAIEEMEKWQKLSDNNSYCENITKYMNACGLNGVYDYCAGFVTYILKETGQDKKIGLPSYSCAVGNFKNVTNGTVQKPNASYIPKPGDLIVYNGTGSAGTWGHIEIVEKVEGKSVYSIGGNTTGPKGLNGYCGKGNIQRRLPVDLSDSSITAYISY